MKLTSEQKNLHRATLGAIRSYEWKSETRQSDVVQSKAMNVMVRKCTAFWDSLSLEQLYEIECDLYYNVQNCSPFTHTEADRMYVLHCELVDYIALQEGN